MYADFWIPRNPFIRSIVVLLILSILFFSLPFSLFFSPSRVGLNSARCFYLISPKFNTVWATKEKKSVLEPVPSGADYNVKCLCVMKKREESNGEMPIYLFGALFVFFSSVSAKRKRMIHLHIGSRNMRRITTTGTFYILPEWFSIAFRYVIIIFFLI